MCLSYDCVPVANLKKDNWHVQLVHSQLSEGSGVARNLNWEGPDGYEPNKTGAPVGLGVDVGCSHIKIFIIIYALT